MFFVDRFQELLNRNSIDSYRVRCNNIFTLIQELRGVIDNWLRGYVKQFDTVRLCIEETLKAINDDNILDYSFYDKQLIIEDLTSFYKADDKKRGELGYKSIYLLDKCIRLNQEIYLEKLYTTINNILSSDDEVTDDQFYSVAEEIDKAVGALASELLNERFSLRHLYGESIKLKNNVDNFDNAFSSFIQRHRHSTSLNHYEVVLKINGGNNDRLTTVDGFLSQLPDDFIPQEQQNEKTNRFLNNRGVLFYRCQLEARDSAMAITLAVEQLESVVDKAILGYSTLDPQIQKKALVVITTSSNKLYQIQPINVRDDNYADDERVVQEMTSKINQIFDSRDIAIDVKDRLTSALRHLRIGNTESDTGQQLVNYWVAMEFIFSSPKAIDSTTTRLEKNLLNILMCCYAHRRISHLNEILHRNGSLNAEMNWWELSDTDLNNLIRRQSSQLTRYHLQEMKGALRNSRDAAKSFFDNHNKHLYWQIYRIYRYRNKLIHEAAILPGLDNVIRCQRFYLVLLLNQLIGYFSSANVKPLSMDSFFFEYAQKVNILNRIIKQDITAEQRISNLMKIEVYSELIRQKI